MLGHHYGYMPGVHVQQPLQHWPAHIGNGAGVYNGFNSAEAMHYYNHHAAQWQVRH